MYFNDVISKQDNNSAVITTATSHSWSRHVESLVLTEYYVQRVIK